MSNPREKLKSQLAAMTALGMYMHDDRGVFINLSLMQLDYDKYIETAKGIEVRLVKNKNNIIQKRERVFLPYLEDIDFSENTVMFNFNEANTRFPRHHHIETEYMIPVTGKIYDLFSGKIYNEGDFIEFPPMTPHELIFPEETSNLVILHPPSFKNPYI